MRQNRVTPAKMREAGRLGGLRRSFCFNSCDIGEPYYEMWRTMVGPKGMTPRQLVGAIVAANQAALDSLGCPFSPCRGKATTDSRRLRLSVQADHPEQWLRR